MGLDFSMGLAKKELANCYLISNAIMDHAKLTLLGFFFVR